LFDRRRVKGAQMSIEAPHLQSNLAKLNVAVSEKNFALLQAVFHSITGERYEEVEVLKIQQQKEDFVPTMNPRDVSPELLIKTIESAIRLSRWDMATTTLSLFDTTNSPENQYQCRSLTCRALLEAQLAQGRKGQAFVDQIFVAISFLLQALTIALSQPRYSFLIHNLVMDFNRIMRPTYRTGYRHLLCEPMQKVADALDTLPTEEVDITQQVQHLINLAACYDEAGKVADAEKAISKARTILGVYDASALPLRTRVLCFQVHLARANPKAIETLVAELAKSGDVEWIPGWQGIIAGQKVKSKIIGADEGMVRAELVKALDQMGYPLPAEEGAPVAVKGAKDAARPKSSAPKGKGKKEEKEKEEGDEKDNAKNLDKLAIVGQVGALACAFNLVDLAEHCAMATRITQQSGLQAAWIYSEFTQHKLALMKAEKATSIPWLEEPEAAALQPRIQALKHLEGTLRSAVRLGSADLIQAGCVDIWNIALPLLQIKYRASVTKAFMTASKALSTLDSPLLELRVQLHLELAKCHIDTDALVAATDEVKSALMLDSTLSESSVKAVLEAHKEEEEAMQDEIQYFQRPLDRYLYPLEAKMRLRQDIYNDPSTPEEAAVLKVEQAADARSSSMKKTILLKTFEILEPPNQKVAPNLSQEQRRQRALIWYDIAQLAWRKPRVVDIVVEACERVLSFKWNHVVDRELVVHQVYTLFVQAQCCVEELTYIEYRPGEEVCSTVIVEEGMEEAPIDKTDGRYMQAMQLNTKLLSTLDKAFKVGELLGQHWVVQNAASFLCNMHHHIFHKQAMLERSVSKGIEVPSVVPDNLLNLLRLSYDAMIRLEPACLDIPLLCNTAVAMARAMESRGQYAAGAEICGKVIPLATPLQKREVLFVFARLHRRAGKETMQVPLPTDRESHVLGLIELLRSPLVKSEDKIKLLDQGEDMLRSTDAGAAPNKAAEKKGGSKPPAKGSKAKVGEEVVEVPRKERTPVETDLEAEMWAELATHGLKLGKLVECMRCATEVLKLTEGVMSSARYRWLSIAETVIGQRMIKLIDPLTQNMTSQDGIRTHSLDHFELSISHAKKCLLSRPNSADVRPYEELVVQPTKWYWNTALPFTRNSLTRKVLRKNLHAILEHCAEAVTAMGTTSGLEPELRGQLYCLMAEIFKDDEDWKGGFDLTTTAFLTIPPKNRKDVWQFRVQFMGELGMDVAAGISKMKDNDQLVQANMWVSLARACKNKLDQFDFYQKAIDSISTPILKVDFVVEYAEWLFTKNFPMQDAQDQLSMVLGLILSCSLLQTHTHAHTHTHTNTYTHINTNTHIYTNTHTHTHTHADTHADTHIHTHTYTHTNTYKNTYTHIYTHAHIRAHAGG
jgi:DNA-binding phage protein